MLMNMWETPPSACLRGQRLCRPLSLLAHEVGYPITALFARTRSAVDGVTRNILFWGGLRGALALALAAPRAVPEYSALMGVAFAVVAFSIFV